MTTTAPALAALVERSAAPAAARLALERLETALPGTTDRLTANTDLAGAVVTVAAASRSLPVLLERDLGALDVLADRADRPPPPTGSGLDESALVTWYQREHLRIAARDLLGDDDLEAVGRSLSELATDVLDAARTLAGATDLVVVGMGKLGGSELNYSSDVDLMLVAPDDAPPGTSEGTARELLRIARRCFRVDANLRPEGRDGPLVRTLASYRAYWERWAAPWEFQALLKARPVAGPPPLAEAFVEAASAALWGRTLSADDLRSLRAMKARTEADVARRGLAARDLKRAAGGIRDIEFAVQLLQLVHGGSDPALRSKATLDALAELRRAAYVDRNDADDLARCYRFLRTVEHRLQLVEGAQTHAVPANPAERERLARVLGFRDDVDAPAVARFDAELTAVRTTVRSLHQRLYFRPLLDVLTGAGPSVALGEEAAEERLVAFGFTDAARTRQAVRELTRGLNRASRLMGQLLPLVLGWLADSPDPDAGLLALRTLASGPQRSSELARAFRESPQTAQRLCLVLGTSRALAEALQHNPDLVPALGDDEVLAVDGRDLAAAAVATVRWRPPEARQQGLRRFRQREELRIASRDLFGLDDVVATAGSLTALAEAVLGTALHALAPPVPLAVVALGRFGGAELSYASDLDVLFVFDGEGPTDFAEAERVATTLLRFVKGRTPAARIYDLDLDLRPEGRHGPLARSLEAFERYFEDWAQPWERLAMLRARPVAGDGDLGGRFMALLDSTARRPPSDGDVREIRRIKARVERERIPPGEDPQFHLKLGRGSLSDVEFTAQLLQLRAGVQAPGTMNALERLVDAGAMEPSDRAVLAEAYRFCEETRNRLFLVRGAGGDSLPSDPGELGRLARSLGTSPGELRESYRRVTRRSRAVVERLFYGRS